MQNLILMYILIWHMDQHILKQILIIIYQYNNVTDMILFQFSVILPFQSVKIIIFYFLIKF